MSQPAVKDHATEFLSDEQAEEIDNNLWWIVGRRSMLKVMLDKAATLQPIKRILEIGCGSGGDMPVLAQYGKVWGIEPSEILTRRALERGIAEDVYQADFLEAEFEEKFDLTCLFDVLEHIEDDYQFVKRISEVTEEGGQLLISVPACQFLYSRHDALLHHHRRYSLSMLHSVLEKNGFEVVRSSYFLFSLFPLVALSRIVEKGKEWLGFEQKDIKLGEVPKIVNTLFTWLLKAESAILKVLPLPIGVWCVALARKKTSIS